jgi:hypothetical protein
MVRNNFCFKVLREGEGKLSQSLVLLGDESVIIHSKSPRIQSPTEHCSVSRQSFLMNRKLAHLSKVDGFQLSLVKRLRKPFKALNQLLGIF